MLSRSSISLPFGKANPEWGTPMERLIKERAHGSETAHFVLTKPILLS